MRTVLCLCLGLAALLPAQDTKHLLIPSAKGPGVTIQANNIERDGPLLRLSGAVEIKSPVCLPVAKGGMLICNGYTLLRAESATFDETTGEIQATGSVSFTPLRDEPTR